MLTKRPHPPRPDRIRSIRESFSWIDHRFFRQGFDQGLTRLEKLLYLVLIAVSNRDGMSFYSDERLAELLEIRYLHELSGARSELIARESCHEMPELTGRLHRIRAATGWQQGMDAVQPFAKQEPARIGRGEAELSSRLSHSGRVEDARVVPTPSPTIEEMRRKRAHQLSIPAMITILLRTYLA